MDELKLIVDSEGEVTRGNTIAEYLETNYGLPKEKVDIVVDMMNQISELKKQNQWISVENEPEKSGEYLAICNPRPSFISYCGIDVCDYESGDGYKKGWYWMGAHGSKVINPTHWMPLPLPPITEKE